MPGCASSPARFYQFQCSVCTKGPETVQRLPMTWWCSSTLTIFTAIKSIGPKMSVSSLSQLTPNLSLFHRVMKRRVDLAHLVLYHLSLCCKRKYFDFDHEILSFTNENWESLLLGAVLIFPHSRLMMKCCETPPAPLRRRDLKRISRR